MTMPSPPEFRFFQELELANTIYSISIYFKSKNYLQYFAILFDNNIVIAMYYFKNYDNIKKFCEKTL